MALLSPPVRQESFSWRPGFRLRGIEHSDVAAFIEIGLPTCSFMHGRPQVAEKEMRRNFASFVREFAFDGGSEVYVVEDTDRKIIAQLWLHTTSNRFNGLTELWIWDLTVCEGFRRQGLGRALLRFARERAHDLNCVELWLLVSSRNSEAVQLYASEGLRDLVIQKEALCTASFAGS